MSSEKEIREVRMMLSERLRNAAKAAMYGTVKSVDENARTCDVQIGGIVYEGVRCTPSRRRTCAGGC